MNIELILLVEKAIIESFTAVSKMFGIISGVSQQFQHISFKKLVGLKKEYMWTSLYARVRDSKNRFEYNKFAYKKTKDDC